jgi:ankyrin repeat protein
LPSAPLLPGEITGSGHLLLAPSPDVNEPGPLDGWTPLMVTCREGYLEIVDLLLKFNADIHVISFKNVHALSAAQASGSLAVLNHINTAISLSSQSKLFLLILLFFLFLLILLFFLFLLHQIDSVEVLTSLNN